VILNLDVSRDQPRGYSMSDYSSSDSSYSDNENEENLRLVPSYKCQRLEDDLVSVNSAEKVTSKSTQIEEDVFSENTEVDAQR